MNVTNLNAIPTGKKFAFPCNGKLDPVSKVYTKVSDGEYQDKMGRRYPVTPSDPVVAVADTPSPVKARNIIKAELERRGLKVKKLQAKTVGFQDLARDSALFVFVDFDKDNPWPRDEGKTWDEIAVLAKVNGFILSTHGI